MYGLFRKLYNVQHCNSHHCYVPHRGSVGLSSLSDPKCIAPAHRGTIPSSPTSPSTAAKGLWSSHSSQEATQPCFLYALHPQAVTISSDLPPHPCPPANHKVLAYGNTQAHSISSKLLQDRWQGAPKCLNIVGLLWPPKSHRLLPHPKPTGIHFFTKSLSYHSQNQGAPKP